MTGRADYLELGSWNAVCYFCGFKHKAADLRRHWQGFYVCERCWEPRQTQDFVRAVPENMTPPWAQPRPAATYAASYRVTSTGTPNAYVVTLPSFLPITALVVGDQYNFTANFTNTGSATLEIFIGTTSLGAQVIKKNGSNLAAGAIVINATAVVTVASGATSFSLS